MSGEVVEIAVVCRLALMHRATVDVDTVVEAAVPSALEVIVASLEGAERRAQRIDIGGTRVDVIETTALTDEALDGVSPANRLFKLSHRWALETAEVMTIRVADSGIEATARVATAIALAATKTGALLDRSEPTKRASDLYDLYRLLEEHDRRGGVAAGLLAAPFGLASLVGDTLATLIADQPEKAARWLGPGGVDMRHVGPDDLQDVFEPLCARLGRSDQHPV